MVRIGKVRIVLDVNLCLKLFFQTIGNCYTSPEAKSEENLRALYMLFLSNWLNYYNLCLCYYFIVLTTVLFFNNVPKKRLTSPNLLM